MTTIDCQHCYKGLISGTRAPSCADDDSADEPCDACNGTGDVLCAACRDEPALAEESHGFGPDCALSLAEGMARYRIAHASR